VRELGFQPEHAGVFISRWHHGSPAHRFGLFALHWILEVRVFLLLKMLVAEVHSWSCMPMLSSQQKACRAVFVC
jgi:hypothetical protein